MGYPDSNQEKQDQNLLCYHYTISQTNCELIQNSNAKVRGFCETAKFIGRFLENIFRAYPHKTLFKHKLWAYITKNIYLCNQTLQALNGQQQSITG